MLKTTIPFVDLRDKTAVDLTRAYPDKARALIAASRRSFGFASYLASGMVLMVLERKSRKWLQKTQNPYTNEIEHFADVVRARGVFTLNLAYEWGCTSGAYAMGETVSLLRVLDWPFPAMGNHIIVTLQSSKAGEYYNVTWPALSGVYNALAPGRFACAINQAPMRKHGLGFAGDWLKNRMIMGKQKALPPSHLLRQVFERAANYAEAKHMLSTIPIAGPAIFILTGLNVREACIIERLEELAEVQDIHTSYSISAANEFHSPFAKYGKGFRPREIDSAGRYQQSTTISRADMQKSDFSWLRSPIINENTRLVMQADAATGTLRVQGYEGSSAVTELFALPPKSL